MMVYEIDKNRISDLRENLIKEELKAPEFEELNIRVQHEVQAQESLARQNIKAQEEKEKATAKKKDENEDKNETETPEEARHRMVETKTAQFREIAQSAGASPEIQRAGEEVIRETAHENSQIFSQGQEIPMSPEIFSYTLIKAIQKLTATQEKQFRKILVEIADKNPKLIRLMTVEDRKILGNHLKGYVKSWFPTLYWQIENKEVQNCVELFDKIDTFESIDEKYAALVQAFARSLIVSTQKDQRTEIKDTLHNNKDTITTAEADVVTVDTLPSETYTIEINEVPTEETYTFNDSHDNNLEQHIVTDIATTTEVSLETNTAEIEEPSLETHHTLNFDEEPEQQAETVEANVFELDLQVIRHVLRDPDSPLAKPKVYAGDSSGKPAEKITIEPSEQTQPPAQDQIFTRTNGEGY